MQAQLTSKHISVLSGLLDALGQVRRINQPEKGKAVYYSRYYLAQECGIDAAAITRLASGKDPIPVSIETAVRLIRKLREFAEEAGIPFPSELVEYLSHFESPVAV